MPWGSSVYATITAYNVVGDSDASEPGNGAIILTIPDAPTNLENAPTVTTANQIGLTWTDGTDDGGSPIIDYTVSYKEQDPTGSYLEDSAVSQNSHTVTGLT